MRALKEFWYRVDALQRTLWLRIAITVIVVAGCGGFFGTLLATSHDLSSQRSVLINALSEQSLADEDEHALSLAETGTVTVNGRTYGGPSLRDRANELFDNTGTIAQPRALASLLIQPEIPQWAPLWLLDQPSTTLLLGVITLIWLLLVIWMSLVVQLLLTLAGTGAATALALWAGSDNGAWLIGGLGLLTFSFIMLTRLLLAALDWPHQSLSVAHTVLKEASRSKISLVFIVILLIVLPLLPLALNPDQPLRFRVQTFISRGMNLTYVVAAVLTLVLSCATIAFEIRDRQIWQLVSKPMSRFSYLFGKWIGVMGLNLVLLTIAGLSIFMYIQFLRMQPVARGMAGQLDAIELRDAVLTARRAAWPDYDQLTSEQLRERVEQEIARNPEYAYEESVPPEVRREIARRIVQAHSLGQRTVPPQQWRTYTFSGLGPAADSTAALTLRYRFHILDDSTHKTFNAAFMFNDQPELTIRREYVPAMAHNLLIGSDLIRPDGTITLSVANLYQPPLNSPYGALNFEVEDFEILYQVGSFEGNFARAMLVTLTKLSFLSVLGILFATFLSFPVALLASFTVFIGGSASPFLAMSLQEFRAPPIFQMESVSPGLAIEWAFKSVVRWIGYVIVYTMGGFGEYQTTTHLVQGRYISWLTVIASTLRLVIVWSGIAFVIGYLIMRSRELATYSGHG